MQWNANGQPRFEPEDLANIPMEANPIVLSNPYLFYQRFLAYAISRYPNDPDIRRLYHLVLKNLEKAGLTPFGDDPEEEVPF